MQIEQRGHLFELHDPDEETLAYLTKIRSRAVRVKGEWARDRGDGRWQISAVAAQRLREQSRAAA